MSRPRGERLAAVVAAMVVLELIAGFTSLVSLRRAQAPDFDVSSVVWTPESFTPDTATLEPSPAPQSSTPAPALPEVTPDQTQAAAPVGPRPEPRVAPTSASPAAPAPRRDPDHSAAHAPAPAPDPNPRTDPRVVAASNESASERMFREQFPVQAAARQNPEDRSTAHWAVLVGVNAYSGRTKHTIGSVADAVLMRQLLLQRGWRDDHILLLLDHNATHDNIVRGMEWLARSTDETSVVVFSFSGHMRYQRGDPDGDGEVWDSGLWPTDNKYLWDSHFVRLVNAIPAERMWLALQGCHSGGMNDPGLEQPGRVITYSSLQREKSYEDPEVGHSVQGWFMFAEGIRDGWGDANSDGQVSVQEALHWGAPRAHHRTANKQTPQLFDGLGQPFHLEVA